MSNEKRLWIIEARDGAWGANGICKGELVRCKECKFCSIHNQWCKRHNKMTSDNWFCADGEVKKDD